MPTNQKSTYRDDSETSQPQIASIIDQFILKKWMQVFISQNTFKGHHFF